MAARYFKKYSPNTPLFVKIDGVDQQLKFDSLDLVLGYYGTEEEGPQKEILRMIREQRGGVSEISKEEYDTEYAQKKMKGEEPLMSPFREELSRSAGLGLVNREVVARAGGASLAALAVKGKSDIRHATVMADSAPEEPAPVQAVPTAPSQPDFQPTLGQRKAPTNVPRKNQNSKPA